jgi:hypothetical protein
MHGRVKGPHQGKKINYCNGREASGEACTCSGARRAKFPRRDVQGKGNPGLGQCLFGVLFRGTCERKFLRKFLRWACLNKSQTLRNVRAALPVPAQEPSCTVAPSLKIFPRPRELDAAIFTSARQSGSCNPRMSRHGRCQTGRGRRVLPRAAKPPGNEKGRPAAASFPEAGDSVRIRRGRRTRWRWLRRPSRRRRCKAW